MMEGGILIGVDCLKQTSFFVDRQRSGQNRVVECLSIGVGPRPGCCNQE